MGEKEQQQQIVDMKRKIVEQMKDEDKEFLFWWEKGVKKKTRNKRSLS